MLLHTYVPCKAHQYLKQDSALSEQWIEWIDNRTSAAEVWDPEKSN